MNLNTPQIIPVGFNGGKINLLPSSLHFSMKKRKLQRLNKKNTQSKNKQNQIKMIESFLKAKTIQINNLTQIPKIQDGLHL
jgi:hypothetical protein